jgi:hypothetical protein
MNRPVGEETGDRQSQRVIDHAPGTHRIHTRADDVIEIGLELCDRSDQ